MSARSDFVPGSLITAGRLGAATIYDGAVRPELLSQGRRASRAIGILRPSDLGIVVSIIDDQQLLIIAGTIIGIVAIGEVSLA